MLGDRLDRSIHFRLASRHLSFGCWLPAPTRQAPPSAAGTVSRPGPLGARVCVEASVPARATIYPVFGVAFGRVHAFVGARGLLGDRLDRSIHFRLASRHLSFGCWLPAPTRQAPPSAAGTVSRPGPLGARVCVEASVPARAAIFPVFQQLISVVGVAFGQVHIKCRETLPLWLALSLSSVCDFLPRVCVGLLLNLAASHRGGCTGHGRCVR